MDWEPGGHDVGRCNEVGGCVACTLSGHQHRMDGQPLLPKIRHTVLPKVKGRREGVEDAIKEGIPACEVALAISIGGTVGVESPSRVE